MLGAMRKNTKVVLWILVGAFIALIFLVWGAESQIGRGGGNPRGMIAKVDGQSIPIEVFNRTYQGGRENFRNSRGVDPGPGDDAQILHDAWTGLVEHTLITREADRMGLEPTDQEIVAEARNNPPSMFTQNPSFQTNGQFDMQKYQALLTNPNVDPQFFVQLEQFIRSTLPLEKVQSVVSATAFVSDPELHQLFRDRNEQARATYRLFEYRSYPLPQPVTDAEAEAYFKAHPEDFRLPAEAVVHFVRIARQPTAADRGAIQQSLTDYAAIARRFAAGDSSAQSFATLAETYSDLPSGADGGYVDHFYGHGELSAPLDQAAFSLPPGGISGPLEDRAGFHIIQADSIQGEGDQKKVRIRDLMIKIEPSDATVTALEDQVSGLKEAALKTGLEAAARSESLQVNAPGPVADGSFIRGMETVAGATEWAFSAAPHDIKVMPANDAWYVVQLVSRMKKGEADFLTLKDMARARATEARQKETASKDAEAFLARMGSSSDWKAASGADSAQVHTVGPISRASGIPGVGREPAALGAVFSLPLNQPSRPIETSRGIVVLKVDQKTPADDSQFESQKQQLTQQVLAQRRQEVYNDWMKHLKDSADIKDFRDLYNEGS